MTTPTLKITAIEVPGGGTLGLTHCPGRSGSPYGERSLEADLDAIEAWGASMLISLIQAHEFERLGVAGFAEAAGRRRFAWHHVPIPDFGTPGAETMAIWRNVAPGLVTALDRGERIVLHCAAGLGRTGTIAAKIVSERGMTADAAIVHVRSLRPGAVETTEQAAFVRNGPKLL